MPSEPSSPSLPVAAHPSPPPLSAGPHRTCRGPPRRLSSPIRRGAPVRSAPTIAVISSRCGPALLARRVWCSSASRGMSTLSMTSPGGATAGRAKNWSRARRRRSSTRAAPAPYCIELSRPSALAGSACSLMGHEVSSVPPLLAESGRPASPMSWAVVAGFSPSHRIDSEIYFQFPGYFKSDSNFKNSYQIHFLSSIHETSFIILLNSRSIQKNKNKTQIVGLESNGFHSIL
jgi:hypothetical protein